MILRLLLFIAPIKGTLIYFTFLLLGMSFFAGIFDFFKHFFQKVRPGLPDFLKKYEQLFLAEACKMYLANDKSALINWKSELFGVLKTELIKDFPALADNWIELGIGFAWEAIKSSHLDIEAIAGVLKKPPQQTHGVDPVVN